MIKLSFAAMNLYVIVSLYTHLFKTKLMNLPIRFIDKFDTN